MQTKMLSACAAAVLVVAFAQQSQPALAADGLNPIMKLRHDRMVVLGDAMKAIDAQVKSAAPDKAKITEAAQVVLATAKDIPGWFPAGTGPETGSGLAKAEIWSMPQEFKAAADRMIAEAEKLAKAAATGQIADIDVQLKATIPACGGCHKPFRTPPPKT